MDPSASQQQFFSVKSIDKKCISGDELDSQCLLMEPNILFLLSSHPNIIRIYNIYDDPSHLHMVLDLCNSSDLYQIISNDDDIEKPNFEKEDELLGLPKGGWDGTESRDDGFLAARERSLKHKLVYLDDDVSAIDEGDEDDDGVSADDTSVETAAAATPDEEEGKKRKRKKKLSLMKRAKEALMEEYYKLDYEDTIGDLKTRFKYAKTKPNRYGLNSGEILMMDDKELNQYVPLKKITPYREKEWKLPNNQRFQLKMKMKEQFYGGKSNFSKKRKHREEVSTTDTTSEQEEKEASNGGELSKQAKRRRRQAGLKLSTSRLTAYGKITTSSKSKSKTKH